VLRNKTPINVTIIPVVNTMALVFVSFVSNHTTNVIIIENNNPKKMEEKG
jgi:hypothetical protein